MFVRMKMIQSLTLLLDKTNLYTTQKKSGYPLFFYAGLPLAKPLSY